MLDKGTVLRYYKREDVQNELVLHAKDKEAVGSFGGEGYSKRPDILSYPKDVWEQVKNGVTSFHASEELWSNPLQLDPMMKRELVEELRIGWDLVIDIDCPYFEYSKIAADLIVKALKHHNIKSVSCKFSGNKGFHIGVPFEAFPKTIGSQMISKRFPDATREVAAYLKEMVKELFAAKIVQIENGDINKIAENIKKSVSDIISGKRINADAALDIDTILISPRHLYRMPYSLHDKSGLVSLPVDPDKVIEFKREDALPEKVKVDSRFRFLDREKAIQDEAKDLFDKATAAAMIRKEKLEFKIEDKKQNNNFDEVQSAIPEACFPPCINIILAGLKDGKKRSLFVLTNFLTSCGWDLDKVETKLKEWNKKNPEPLREVNIEGHIRYQKQRKQKVLPPNCTNQMYYKEIAVCKPDNLCARIKNPVQYAKRKAYFLNKEQKVKQPRAKKSKAENAEPVEIASKDSAT